MSNSFFEVLKLPDPDYNLECKGGQHGKHTACVLEAYEQLCLEKRPDLTVVVGDVNSTLACALAAVKLHVPVAHLEAGLRSFNREMPEEINRIVTDQVSDYLWVPSKDGLVNLENEGCKGILVGNIMIDSYEMLKDEIQKLQPWKDLGLVKNSYGMLTLHRPSNVDNEERLKAIVRTLKKTQVWMVFPVHPRTAAALKHYGLLKELSQSKVIMTEPMNYLQFMALVENSRFVLTDSGGIQEETSYLGIPCLTLRKETERPITVSLGTNRLVSLLSLEDSINEALETPRRRTSIPLWDGQTAKRVHNEIDKIFKD